MKDKSITIKDVAKKSGVSVGTVSRAFNNYSDISESTRQHILEVAEKMGYKPNIAAKSLSSNKSFRLGMLIEDEDEEDKNNVSDVDPFMFQIVVSFKNEASKQGYEMVLFSTTSDMQKNNSISKLFSEKQIDGLFIAGLKITDEYYKQLQKIDKPCVLWDLEIKNPKVGCVGVSNIRGAFMAVEHLIKLGHKKIGFINGHKEAFVSYERLDGYYLALSRYGMTIDNNFIVYSDFTDKGGYEETKQFIENNKDITAIFCASDLMAVGAINALSDMGYSVPKDVSVVGFDDTYTSQYMKPRLTTIRQDKGKIGEIAANVLINIISGKEMGRVLIEPELILRESTNSIPK
jgi:LacI family transcriptional regulator